MARSTYDDFAFQDRIGSGSFGVVWRAVRKQDGQSYAIKEIDLQGMGKKVRGGDRKAECMPTGKQGLLAASAARCAPEIKLKAAI